MRSTDGSPSKLNGIVEKTRAKLILEASLTNVIADPICAHMNQRMGAAVDRFVLEPARTIASASHKI